MIVEQLHTDYGDYLLKCIQMYGVAEDDCEDVRQDIYLKLLETKRVIRDTNVKGFCSKLARDAAVDYLRKRSRCPTVESLMIVDENGVAGIHPEIDTMMVRNFQSMMGSSNIERIARALQWATEYRVTEDVTAYDIIADLLYGLTTVQIADKYEVDRRTVARWFQKWYKHVRSEEKIPNG